MVGHYGDHWSFSGDFVDKPFKGHNNASSSLVALQSEGVHVYLALLALSSDTHSY